ncbi:YhdP family protein [Psychromonas sp. MME2]|uniref:YhdP family protein n=1 Tax=Psychromonas sp. MME2 TaxID=3231033 RepID=UPI00339CD1AA
MKLFLWKWTKRLWALLAIKLFIIATCLTLVRILFVRIEYYKEDVTNWLASEYNINVSVDNISAGIDFSGLVFILNNTKLIDSAEQPVYFASDYLFLHLDFWNSVTQKHLSFNKITLKGVDLRFNESAQGNHYSEQETLTFERLQQVFLQQFKQFSVTDGRVHFKNPLGQEKTIVIEKLHWLNAKNRHQGVGSASFGTALKGKPLQFVIDLSPPQNDSSSYIGQLYAEADNLDLSGYLAAHVNPNAQISKAMIGLQVWADFTLDKLQQIQIKFNNSDFAWSQAGKNHDWQVNSGVLQLTNGEHNWLLDTYNIDAYYDKHPLKDLAIAATGTMRHASVLFKGVNVNALLPLYLLNSDLSTPDILQIEKLDVDAKLSSLMINQDLENRIIFDVAIKQLKNKPVGAIPGLSHANIYISGAVDQGDMLIELDKQDLYFDEQFNRPMPIEAAQLNLQWQTLKNGIKLSSEQSVITTTDVDTITEFSLLIPNEKSNSQSPFLSLYSYASLNDASKAQHYFPIKELGQEVFDYLQPTFKKGHVDGAKILWYGALSDYPYRENNGIFQAWVPLRDAEYDFYGQWQGLSNLDLNLHFENDWLKMEALRASLGDVQVAKLSANIDTLSPDGVLTIAANIADKAQSIATYLKTSPLKESVGSTLHIIDVQKQLSGKLEISVPFADETEITGQVVLADNDINIHINDDVIIPLNHVQGEFSFVNGNLTGNNLTAQLFKHPLQFSFNALEKTDKYEVDVDLSGQWDAEKLAAIHSDIAALNLSGSLAWQGKIDFDYFYENEEFHYKGALDSMTQGLQVALPAPFNKNSLQSWPMKFSVSGDKDASLFSLNIADKLDLQGKLDYQGADLKVPYATLNIGMHKIDQIDSDKQVVNIDLDKLDIAPWYSQWRKLQSHQAQFSQGNSSQLIKLDTLDIHVKEAQLFEQAINELQINSINIDNKWSIKYVADNLQGNIEYRLGMPDRIDLDINKMEFKDINIAAYHSLENVQSKDTSSISTNLLADYPEVFASCERCLIAEYDFSPLALHIFPTKSRLNIDYIKLGDETEFTKLSGVWDQRRSNMIIDSLANDKQSILNRMGYVGPIVFQKAELTGAVNWLGAPWEFNYASLNGVLSMQIDNGSITDVSDKGARLLSLFSLDAIRRSLNLEFNNVFAKGFNFNKMTLSANVNNGIANNDDFYLDGAAGKIVGKGIIDLPNQETNYKFSYSPAVTSSLPVLTAFAINPITGAAVLLMSKLFEPVVDTVVRVDFSVKGSFNDPQVKMVSRERGQVELQNSEVLEKINEEHLNDKSGQP